MEKFLTKVRCMTEMAFKRHMVHEKVDENELVNTLIL